MRVLPSCDFIAKVFSKRNVARTGFAQIGACAHRTVSERSPVEERIARHFLPRRFAPIFFLDAIALHRRAHPPLPFSIDHLHLNFSDSFLKPYTSSSTLRVTAQFASRFSRFFVFFRRELLSRPYSRDISCIPEN